LLLFVLLGCYLCCSVYCLCVNVYCHRVTTRLQLTNISYHSHSVTIKPAITLQTIINKSAVTP
jgi:hypothetical protein